MANTLEIKKRITSVKNTKQITKAMELVSASKLKRAQEDALKSRPYYNSITEMLEKLVRATKVSKNAFYISNKSENILLVIISSDRGLAGAYNNNILRFALNYIIENPNLNFKVVAIGRKSAQAIARLDSNNVELVAEFEGFSEKINESKLLPILEIATNMFLKSEIGKVKFIYTEFISSLKQEPSISDVLPIKFKLQDDEPFYKPILEPSAKELLKWATKKFIETIIIQKLFEAAASEHSSRMFAMKNASDNASDLIDDLTLAMNSARQAAITQELAEISAGAAAVS
ncbi:MAG TPA: ATP synthase F1 subunit gamma [Candidatus Saccharibacteria bacterium]|nr:ATP synthase F1 subunit gamma [Candidatus Saccharibacteria bacterium]